MKQFNNIIVSAPGKIHLLGEHAVVYGKPAILAAVDLRVTVTIRPEMHIEPIVQIYEIVKKTVENVVKKYLQMTKIPPYSVEISSKLPVGAGLGSSAAVSAAYIAALLSFLKVKWDQNLVNNLAYEAEKVFHGNPSGGDNSIVVYGGLIWFRKETPDLKIIQSLNFTIPQKLARNFVLIDTGRPKESTAEMVQLVSSKYKVQSAKFKKIFDDQERLVKELLPVIKEADEKEFIKIIKEGERNLESIGVVSKYAASIIRKIETIGGAAKICGAGGKSGPTGILLCYHNNKKVVENLAKSYNLPCFSVKLGVEGVKYEL